MHRKPSPYPSIFEDTLEAGRYARSVSRRLRRIGAQVAEQLTRDGVTEATILDAGCGSGDLAIAIAQPLPGVEVVGVDLSRPLLGIARRSAEDAGVASRVSFEMGDVLSLPFTDDTFDHVYCLNMLHIVGKPVTMLDEVARVLRPGGGFGVGAIRRSWIGLFVPIFAAAYSSGEARDLLKQSQLPPWTFEEQFLYWMAKGSG